MGTVPTLPFWGLAWKPLQPVADDGHLDAKMGVRKRRADRGAEEEKGVRVRGRRRSRGRGRKRGWAEAAESKDQPKTEEDVSAKRKRTGVWMTRFLQKSWWKCPQILATIQSVAASLRRDGLGLEHGVNRVSNSVPSAASSCVK